MGAENKKEAENSKLAEARKIAKNKVAFIRHFITYISVLMVLAIINNVTSRSHQWWIWVALFWGIGVFFNFMSAYLFKGGGLKKMEEDLTRREMERLGETDEKK